MIFVCFQIATENGIPNGARTSEFYRTNDIPNRFENPGRTFCN